MKRIIAGMLLLALLLTCAAAGAEDGKSYASGFKLRQGLSFGATAADVAAAEKLTPNDTGWIRTINFSFASLCHSNGHGIKTFI